MRRVVRVALFWLAVLFVTTGNLCAQSLSIAPLNSSVPVGGTLQFSVTATGLSSNSVTWSVAGVVGGNATNGTISSTGLYTAPATIPGQNPVQITAKSTVTRGVSATTYVGIMPLPPNITSISPNPLPQGGFTVTVNGTGVLAGAEIYISYGSNSLIQLSTTGYTSTSVTGTGYVGPSSTASFCVKNPGSAYSNSISVPVANKYSLVVSNGSGGGNYLPGTVVTITANAPASGRAFLDWTGATVANANASTTTLIMPAANTTVKANYYTPTYALTVIGGSGSGNYAAGAQVYISANAPHAGQAFQDWTGATVANANASSTSLTMPATATTVMANYYTPTYALTVVGGTGSGDYASGTVVPITAATPPAGDMFSGWTGASVTNASASSTTLTMPAAATTVTANFAPQTYTLTVVGGGGSGNYAAGTVVSISAPAAPAGEMFSGWTGAMVVNPSSLATTLTMPAASTTVTANYSPITYTLTVVNGSGSGSYAAGTVVTIVGGALPSGETFAGWTGASVANASDLSTTLTMPAANTTVTANYSTPSSNYTLTVVGGSGSGTYAAGTVVTITAGNAPAGEVFSGWTGASVANAGSSSTTITMPAADTTVTANYSVSNSTYTLTVVSGSGSGNYAAGTVVTITADTPPSGDSFQGWTGAPVADPSALSTTLTMLAANVSVAATYTGPSTIPFPVTTHPRLWITQNDLPRLQSWATASNPTYANGMLPMLQTAVNLYQTQFFPDGVPNPNYPDPGDVQGYTGYLTEQYAAILAFNSLIDPNPANRITYAQYARNMLMYALNQAALGHLANAPFRDPAFAIYNRANFSGDQWPLIVDWIYNATDSLGNPILTASDKATIQTVFMMWANDCLNASTTGGDHPSPIGTMNSVSLLPNNQPYRMASNNYYLGHARILTMMSLVLDPADDPPVDPTQSSAVLGNSMRSYIQNATGAWLYQEFAMMGDPSVVPAAYGLPANSSGFGLASGGMPPEGMLYGHSFGFVLGQLLALQTAGFNDPNLSGPQIGLIGAPVWDRFVTAMLSSFTPGSMVPPSEPWDGAVYQFASYGDLLRLWVTPDFMQPYALLALLEAENGSTAHANAARWYVVNVTQGGPGAFNQRMTQPWSTDETIFYYLLLDPTAAPGTDPRPTYPNVIFDPAAGRIIAHSDWTANGTMFDYRASWISINHQDGDGGQFELFRKGEFLTKEMSNYDNNLVGMTTVYHNTLALQNWCPNGTPDLSWFESGEWANGSQWMEGADAGDPTTLFSTGPGYVYATSDLTNLFNRPDIWDSTLSATDVTQATRSIVWLNNDYVVVYDRATTQHSGLFKQIHLSLVNPPSITGNVATETMPDNQQLFIQTLLPQNPALSFFDGAVNLNPIAELEPTRYIYQVADSATPSDTRFLHVLQGADPGAPMATATYQQSTSGTPFDGAVFGTAAVYFPVSASAPFTGTTVSAPAGVQTLLVTGLAPNNSYGISVQPNGSGNVVSIAAGGVGATTDAAGVLDLPL
jgi:uncharacterized repeat protein (TIGR02543 family)